MHKKSFLLIFHVLFLLMIVACSDGKVDEEIDTMFEALSTDQSGDRLIELLEAVYAEESYEDELAIAKEETEKTLNGLQSLELSTSEAQELQGLFVSSLKDFQTIIEQVETKGPQLSDDDWEEIEDLSKEANEKQMELIREKFQRMDIDELVENK